MGGLPKTRQRAVPSEAAFSCVTEVEQHPQREEEPHNRNDDPPAILLCHESPARACLSTGWPKKQHHLSRVCSLGGVGISPAGLVKIPITQICRSSMMFALIWPCPQ
jgi:hypothetical protein